MSILTVAAALPPPEDIRRTAEGVVRRPYFDLGNAPLREASSWLLDVLRWILKPFEWLYEILGGLPEFVRWLVVAVCVVLCIALIAHIIYTLVSAIRVPSVGRGRAFKPSAAEIDPVDLEREAESLVARGDYIGAVRLLFRAAIRRIELAETRRFRPGFSNRELLRRYRSTPLGQSLQRLVETIELKWYGNALCEQSDYLACRSDHERICQYVRERGAAVRT